MNIRSMRDADGDVVMQIYQEGCDTGHATFAETAGTWGAWDAGHLSECRLVAQSDDGVLGSVLFRKEQEILDASPYFQ